MEILCKWGKNPCYSDSVERWERFNPHTKITALDSPSSVKYMHPPTTHERPLQGWVTPATKTTALQIAGLFIWKGYEMKKYIPVDFDEKGNAVLGRAKNTPTSNGFIPTTWTPGGSDDGSGIKSITISPAITTTPSLESLCPIYYGDERIVGDEFTTELSIDESSQPVMVTITPTADVYIGAYRDGYAELTNKGEARTFEIEPVGAFILMSDFCFCTSTDYADAVYLNITITSTK